MLFTELRFLPFFLLVFAVHWALRGERLRKTWLLAASYAFYAAWDWRFLSLILISTLVDYVAGIKIDEAHSTTRRKVWLAASLFANLGILGFFKYCNFFIDSASVLLTWLGLETGQSTLNIILPVGISFFTFQTMSYSLDIYSGKLKPTRSLLNLALFVGFFPQLVAGPIVRAADFLPQLKSARRLADVSFKAALLLFLSGFIKKACISDNLAPLVDAYFQNPEAYGVAAAWMAVVSYAVQIYCDFSGYSDMAIASAALLGYRLCLNFNFPYLATDISDFWRRWHISLSSWLRDYLYIPLGGSRGSRFATQRNLMLTMLLGGLWHGAAWTFVVWGGLHGGALALHRIWARQRQSGLLANGAGALLARGISLISPLLTFWFVCVCWIFFRAQDFAGAWIGLRAFVCFDATSSAPLPAEVSFSWWLFPVLLAIHLCVRWTTSSARLRELPDWLFASLLGGSFALALAFTRADYLPFIYFQF